MVMSMGRPKSLDPNVVQTWLAAWRETELYSDAAVSHLASLIEDPYCVVVVTRGVGREVRSLVFRIRRGASPVRSDLGSQRAAYWQSRTDFIHPGEREAPIILMQGKSRGFMEALAFAHEAARWSKQEAIYTYDDSTWGNA
jgi:hypothetical protein